MLLKKMLTLFIPFAILICLGTTFIYLSESNRVRSEISSKEKQSVHLGAQGIKITLGSIFKDLLLISQHTIDRDSYILNHLYEEWMPLARIKPEYDQVRWLDETGMERVRINSHNGQPQSVPFEKLQNKAGRYYFDDCLTLNSAEIFVSPLDLNIEKDTIELPYKPMLRVGTPVYDSKGNKRGIFLINYLGSNLLKKFSEMGGEKLELLNSDGFWLKGEIPSEEWGFMLKRDDLSLKSRRPDVWNRIMSERTGQFETSEGLWTFESIYPLQDGCVSSTGSRSAFEPSVSEITREKYRWISLSHLPASQLNVPRNYLIGLLGISGSLLLLIAFVATYRLAKAQVEEILLKEKLSEKVDELTNLTRELEVSRDVAESANHAKSIFLANMSHEIRTPLNVVIGFSELVSVDMVDPKQKNRLAVIKSAGGSLLRLINDILDLSKVEAHRMEIVPVVCDIPDTLREIISMFQISAEQKAITLQLEVGSIHLPSLFIDESHLRQAVLNLVSNAIKFTEKGGVRVMASRDSSSGILTIQVNDTGSGIAADQQERIFESFRQIEGQNRSKFGGTGLGLSISKKLIELMGGTLTVASEQGIGTTFSIAVPAPEASAIDKRDSQDKHWNSCKFNGQSILVVDDVDHNRHYLEELFSICNLSFVGASSGAQAIELCQSTHFDLIFLDIRMPDMSGIDVFKKLKLLNVQQDVPILALTASATAEEKEEIRKIGFAKYLSKPIEPARLVEVLSAWLSFTRIDKVAEINVSSPLTAVQREELRIVESKIGSLLEATVPIDFTAVEKIAEELHACSSIPEIVQFAQGVSDNLAAFDISSLSESSKHLAEICKKLTTEVQHG